MLLKQQQQEMPRLTFQMQQLLHGNFLVSVQKFLSFDSASPLAKAGCLQDQISNEP